MIDQKKEKQGIEDLLISINKNKSLFAKRKANRLFNRDSISYSDLYSYFKEIIDNETSIKLDQIDGDIERLFRSLKANFVICNEREYGLDCLGPNAISGYWEDKSVSYDGGYYDTTYYQIGYYPEVGFVDENNPPHSTKGKTTTVLGNGPYSGVFEHPDDDRRDPARTVKKFMEDNKETLDELHTLLLQKKEILCTHDNTTNPKDKEICQKINYLFELGINSYEPKQKQEDKEKEEDITQSKKKSR